MLFNSFHFLLFFPTVVILYFLLPHRFRWFFLLMASCYFYMAFIPVYILILLATILVDYFAAIWIERSQGKQKKVYLIISIVSTCAILFVFKYFNFFNANLSQLAKVLHWNYSMDALSLILPIGLSFHTFQSLSYVIEVYRGHQKAERHFGIYSLYVMFFPQLVAGPIERPQNLLHQFYEKHSADYARITSGLKLILWGLFKKVVIADRVAIYVNQVFSHPEDYYGRILIWIMYCFAIQIYCDFSGYSDIARGSARVLGFELMKNFKSPYLATSIVEFWRRWHISLSTWFKDYVYIPLGGSRRSMAVWYRNVMIVFLVSGFWHGANWTFVIWGAIHGLYMIVSGVSKRYRDAMANIIFRGWFSNLRQLWQIFLTFQLVCLAWVFFRAESLKDVWAVLTGIFGSATVDNQDFVEGFNMSEKIFIALCVVVMELVQSHKKTVVDVLAKTPQPLRWTLYYCFIFFIVFMGTYKTQQFIYFQF